MSDEPKYCVDCAHVRYTRIELLIGTVLCLALLSGCDVPGAAMGQECGWWEIRDRHGKVTGEFWKCVNVVY